MKRYSGLFAFLAVLVSLSCSDPSSPPSIQPLSEYQGAAIGPDGLLHLYGKNVVASQNGRDFTEMFRFHHVGRRIEVQKGSSPPGTTCEFALRRRFTVSHFSEQFIEHDPSTCEWVVAVGYIPSQVAKLQAQRAKLLEARLSKLAPGIGGNIGCGNNSAMASPPVAGDLGTETICEADVTGIMEVWATERYGEIYDLAKDAVAFEFQVQNGCVTDFDAIHNPYVPSGSPTTWYLDGQDQEEEHIGCAAQTLNTSSFHNDDFLMDVVCTGNTYFDVTENDLFLLQDWHPTFGDVIEMGGDHVGHPYGACSSLLIYKTNVALGGLEEENFAAYTANPSPLISPESIRYTGATKADSPGGGQFLQVRAR